MLHTGELARCMICNAEEVMLAINNSTTQILAEFKRLFYWHPRMNQIDI